MSYQRHCDFPGHEHAMEPGPYLMILITNPNTATPAATSEFCGPSVRDGLDDIMGFIRHAIRDERQISIKWETNWQLPTVDSNTPGTSGWWDATNKVPDVPVT